MGKSEWVIKPAAKAFAKTFSQRIGPYKWIGHTVKNAAIGGLAGGVAGRTVADSHGAKTAENHGAIAGAIAGGVTGLPFGRIARGTYRFSLVVGRGLKASPNSSIGAALRGVDRAGERAGIIFRRIRGRIVPIRGK